MVRRKIAPDFCDYSVLRIGEVKWKRAKKFLEQFAAPTMRCPGSNRRLSAPRRDQHLHREKFGENKMLARCAQRFPIFREMNRANRNGSVAAVQSSWQQCFEPLIIHVLQKSINDSPQVALRK